MNTTPYWMASEPLPQFESIQRDIEADAAIVGAELTGITAAHLLKQAGAKVALLERDRCANADTGHTTAHLTMVTDLRLHRLVKNFGKECGRAFWEAGAAAIDRIHALVRDKGIECKFNRFSPAPQNRRCRSFESQNPSCADLGTGARRHGKDFSPRPRASAVSLGPL